MDLLQFTRPEFSCFWRLSESMGHFKGPSKKLALRERSNYLLKNYFTQLCLGPPKKHAETRSPTDIIVDRNGCWLANVV